MLLLRTRTAGQDACVICRAPPPTYHTRLAAPTWLLSAPIDLRPRAAGQQGSRHDTSIDRMMRARIAMLGRAACACGVDGCRARRHSSASEPAAEAHCKPEHAPAISAMRLLHQQQPRRRHRGARAASYLAL